MNVLELLKIAPSLSINSDVSTTQWQTLEMNAIKELSHATAGDMVLTSKPDQVHEAIQKGIRIISYLKKIRGSIPFREDVVFLESPSFAQTLSEVLPALEYKKTPFAPGPMSVDPTAKLGLRVQIAPFCVIGANAEIGDDVILGPNTIVEAHARIGARTVMAGHNFIGHHCEVGEGCLLHSHTCIGSDGFGFFTNKNGEHSKVPQIGNVVIENDVEMGAHCAVDRATLGTTYVRQGTKLDNFCHVSHNCDVGAYGLMAGGFMVAGSTKIGHHFICGGGTHISDHATITDHVTLAGRSGVVADITEPGVYGGFPLQPIKEYLKNQNNVRQLTNMRKSIDRILKHLGLSLNRDADQ